MRFGRFRLYGPSDPTCSNAPAFVSAPVPVNGNAAYTSGLFSPGAPGIYSWIATYSGDSNNASATGACGQPLATVDLAALPVILVPTLSPAALAFLVLGLAAAGVLAARRNRADRT